MKRILLSMAIMMIACVSVIAQVPTVMMYQVQIKHDKAAAQDVTVEMQLRNTQEGSAVWSQTFKLKDVKSGCVQNLGLDFGDKINLGTGEYWLATIVDGNEMGCAKLTSVPYALVAKEEEGGINMPNIVGTWRNSYDKGTYTYTRTLTLNEDGTFHFTYTYPYMEEVRTEITDGTYRILTNGIIYSEASDTKNCDQVARIDNNHIMTMTDGGRFGKLTLYTRQ